MQQLHVTSKLSRSPPQNHTVFITKRTFHHLRQRLLSTGINLANCASDDGIDLPLRDAQLGKPGLVLKHISESSRSQVHGKNVAMG